MLRMEIQLHGLVGLAAPLLRRRMRPELERDIATIKAGLEGVEPPPPGPAPSAPLRYCNDAGPDAEKGPLTWEMRGRPPDRRPSRAVPTWRYHAVVTDRIGAAVAVLDEGVIVHGVGGPAGARALERDQPPRPVRERTPEVAAQPQAAPVRHVPGHRQAHPIRLIPHQVVPRPFPIPWPPKGTQTCLGTLPVRVNTKRIALCPGSAVGSNIRGQPPSITLIPCCRPYSVAAPETLPAPNARCIHTYLMPSSTHSRIVPSASSGLVPMTTASTPPGTDFRSW